MKAQDYAAIFRAAPSAREGLQEVGIKFAMEHKEMCNARNVKSETQIISILRELDLKWKAWSKEFPEVRPDGFKIIIHSLIPTSKEIWP